MARPQGGNLASRPPGQHGTELQVLTGGEQWASRGSGATRNAAQSGGPKHKAKYRGKTSKHKVGAKLWHFNTSLRLGGKSCRKALHYQCLPLPPGMHADTGGQETTATDAANKDKRRRATCPNDTTKKSKRGEAVSKFVTDMKTKTVRRKRGLEK